MGRTGLIPLQTALLASLLPKWTRFQRAAADPRRAQLNKLRGLLTANEDTAYGKEVGLFRISSVADYQTRVPIVDYDELEPWIHRIVSAGEANVLTKAPVRMLEVSGGSTNTNKLIPYTDHLIADFSEAVGAWIFDLYRRIPTLWGTRSYWSMSPVTRGRRTTASGLPIGFEDDTEYLDPLSRWAQQQLQAVPSDVVHLPTMDLWRRVTLRHLLAARDLGLVSVWSPTFLTRLMQALEADLPRLLDEQSPARAEEIQRALDARGVLHGEAIWPHLALISCWCDGSSASFVGKLRRWFPRVTIQPKGLLATEGVVSFPLGKALDGVLAVSSHFLEFIDMDNPRHTPLLAHELRPGGTYSPLLTTSGGLYRYHLKDLVRCTGTYLRIPRIHFVGKLDRVSDLFGEKINAQQVNHALHLAEQDTGSKPSFALLAPVPADDDASAHYRLFVESTAADDTLSRIAQIVEDYLATGHHYHYCRNLGQLGPIQVQRVCDGWTTYERCLIGLGQRAGDIKPTHLDHRPIWASAFAAEPKMPFKNASSRGGS